MLNSFIRQTKWTYLVAGLFSLILSYWFSARETVINPDAICYLQSAAEMKSGLHAAMHLCDQASWPFYAILIHAVSTVTSFSYKLSADCLDAIFSLISVFTFISIIQFITKNTRIVALAAVVILLAHEFNSIRQYIVRDHGFWAFYLLSIYFLLRYFREHKWIDALAWSVSLVIATLFRVEGAIFLTLIPFLSFLEMKQSVAQRFKAFFQLNTLTIIAMITLVLSMLMSSKIELTRLHDVQYQFIHGVPAILKHFTELKIALADHVLGHDSARDAGMVLFLMLATWYAVSVAINVSLIYMALIIYAWCKRLLHADNAVRLVLWGYVGLSVVVTVAFLAEHMFLSKRYLIALSLVLMMWVPFALDNLLKQSTIRKWPAVIATLFIMASAIGGIIDFGYSKQYIHDAGQWLADNAPKEATIYSNNYQVMYYSNHFDNTIFEKARAYEDTKMISDGKWKQYDYIALLIHKNDLADKSNVANEIQYKVVQVFLNKRGDQVRIYRREKL